MRDRVGDMPGNASHIPDPPETLPRIVRLERKYGSLVFKAIIWTAIALVAAALAAPAFNSIKE